MAKIVDYGAPLLCPTMGVGPGRANNIDDVLLVQFMLNIYFQDKSNAVARQRAGTNGKALKEDGLIGPKTKAQILMFQRAMSAEGFTIQRDGCIDRLPALSVPHKVNYSILLLHVKCKDITGEEVHDMGALPWSLAKVGAEAGVGPEWARLN